MLVLAGMDDPGEIRLRRAEAWDGPAIRALLAEAGLPLAGVEDGALAGYVVAEDEGGARGAAGVERYGDHGLLRSVVVAPGARGRALGRRLVEDRLAWARERPLASLWLLTSGAEGWFERLGFRRAPRSEAPAGVRASAEFAALCPASAVAMVLAIAPREGPH